MKCSSCISFSGRIYNGAMKCSGDSVYLKMERKRHDLKKLQKKIDLVEKMMQDNFPLGYYTTRILLLNDGTSMVECRLGEKVGDEVSIHNIRHYDGKVNYEAHKMNSNQIKVDHLGKEYYVLTEQEEREQLLNSQEADDNC